MHLHVHRRGGRGGRGGLARVQGLLQLLNASGVVLHLLLVPTAEGGQPLGVGVLEGRQLPLGLVDLAAQVVLQLLDNRKSK